LIYVLVNAFRRDQGGGFITEKYYKNNKKINFELKVKWNSFFNQSKSSSDIIWKEIKKDTIV